MNHIHTYISIHIKFKFILFTYLLLISIAVHPQRFETIKSDQGIEILEKGKRVLFYQVKPKVADGKYVRAGYVHPLYSLSEKILTEDMPPDHPYHRGIFWAWHQILLNDKNIADGWISENISWKPLGVKINKSQKKIMLQSEMNWNVKQDHDSTAIVKEITKITIFKATSHYRVLDFEIQLFPLVENLKIGGSDDAKGYGGFCLRLKLPKDLSFVSENKNIIAKETPVLAGPWMEFRGSFEGEALPVTGVVVFGYPFRDNHQHPWILRKESSMQNIPYPGRTPVVLSKNGLKLKYRVIVHNGAINNEEIEKLYQQYIHTP